MADKIAYAGEPDPAPEGWLGTLTLEFACRGGRTLLTKRQHRGPFMVQRAFYPEADYPHIYLLHPPGGVVGGDRLELSVSMAPESHALLTTPGATKFYRTAGAQAGLSQRFHLGEGSTLEWLPQGNIFFPAADVAIHSEFFLRPGARLIGYDTLCLGRPAIGERFEQGTLDSVLHIHLPDSAGLFERLRINDGQMDQVGGYSLNATFFATPVTEAMLAGVRDLLTEAELPAAGASMVDSLLVVRLLDNDNQRLQNLLHRIWILLRPEILGRGAVAPRIWAT